MHTTNDVGRFEIELADRLETIRVANKQVFFDCLTLDAIEAMEPKYDQP